MKKRPFFDILRLEIHAPWIDRNIGKNEKKSIFFKKWMSVTGHDQKMDFFPEKHSFLVHFWGWTFSGPNPPYLRDPKKNLRFLLKIEVRLVVQLGPSKWGVNMVFFLILGVIFGPQEAAVKDLGSGLTQKSDYFSISLSPLTKEWHPSFSRAQ